MNLMKYRSKPRPGSVNLDPPKKKVSIDEWNAVMCKHQYRHQTFIFTQRCRDYSCYVAYDINLAQIGYRIDGEYYLFEDGEIES